MSERLLTIQGRAAPICLRPVQAFPQILITQVSPSVPGSLSKDPDLPGISLSDKYSVLRCGK